MIVKEDCWFKRVINTGHCQPLKSTASTSIEKLEVSGTGGNILCKAERGAVSKYPTFPL
jgi:hypothetical protein